MISYGDATGGVETGGDIAAPVAHDVVLWRFVDRVRALTPAQWGALDAHAAPIDGSSPLARARRLRVITLLFGGAWGNMLRDFGATIAADPWPAATLALAPLQPAFWDELRKARQAPPAPPPELAAEFADQDRAWRALAAVIRAQPLGPRAAGLGVFFAYFALCCRADAPPSAVARAYAYVEPVIPFASLSHDQPLLPRFAAPEPPPPPP